MGAEKAEREGELEKEEGGLTNGRDSWWNEERGLLACLLLQPLSAETRGWRRVEGMFPISASSVTPFLQRKLVAIIFAQEHDEQNIQNTLSKGGLQPPRSAHTSLMRELAMITPLL